MRKTKSIRTRLDGNFNLSLPVKEEASDSDTDLTGCEDFVFGIWLRHRRIDGALNRVPAEFYEVIIYFKKCKYIFLFLEIMGHFKIVPTRHYN